MHVYLVVVFMNQRNTDPSDSLGIPAIGSLRLGDSWLAVLGTFRAYMYTILCVVDTSRLLSTSCIAVCAARGERSGQPVCVFSQASTNQVSNHPASMARLREPAVDLMLTVVVKTESSRLFSHSSTLANVAPACLNRWSIVQMQHWFKRAV